MAEGVQRELQELAQRLKEAALDEAGDPLWALSGLMLAAMELAAEHKRAPQFWNLLAVMQRTATDA